VRYNFVADITGLSTWWSYFAIRDSLLRSCIVYFML